MLRVINGSVITPSVSRVLFEVCAEVPEDGSAAASKCPEHRCESFCLLGDGSCLC